MKWQEARLHMYCPTRLGLSKGPHLHFSVTKCPNPKDLHSSDCYSEPVTFKNTSPHPRGLIVSPTSEIGGGEWYEAQ